MALVTYNRPEKNVSNTERILFSIGALGLTAFAIKKGGRTGAILGATAGTFLYRAASGFCLLYEAIGVNTAKKTTNPIVSVPHGEGIKVEKTITVNKSKEELYTFWRNLENLPRFMEHLESVTKIDDLRSHWVAKGPAGTRVEWDAEIHNEIPNELIAWRSLEGSEVDHAGSVEFKDAPLGRGTEIKVVVNYKPPVGKLGALLAKVLPGREEPSIQIDEDLFRFKQLMEAGEIPTTHGQPTGAD